jgi:hypothetical protein
MLERLWLGRSAPLSEGLGQSLIAALVLNPISHTTHCQGWDRG